MSGGHEAGEAVGFVRVPGGPRPEYVERGDRAGTPGGRLHGHTGSWRALRPGLKHKTRERGGPAPTPA